MATHPNILAWRIPWTEEPGRLQSMGSQELDTTQQLNHHHIFFMVYSSTFNDQYGSVGKESACNAGDLSLSPGSGRSPGKGNSYPLQYSCLVNSMDRRAWWTTAHEGTESDPTWRLTASAFFPHFLRIPRWCSGKESTLQCRRCKRCEFDPWVEKIPSSGKCQLTPVFLPRKSHGQRSLTGYNPWGCKEQDTTE